MNLEINIGIATYKRHERLNNLLERLISLKVPKKCQIKVLVVDNDANETAKPIVEQYQGKNYWPIEYLTQPKQNIALARNTILEATTGDYLYFIDDDEYPAEDCLEQLFLTAMQFEADVVFGPVLPIYPDKTPSWIVKGNLFGRENHPTGSLLLNGATNNTLLKCKSFKKYKLQFNPEYGLTGGEDSEFFSRFYKLGARLIWCNDALVYEPVAPERLKRSWLLRRAYRGGQAHAKIYYSTLDKVTLGAIILKRLVYLLVSIIYVVLAVFFGQVHLIKALRKVASCVGQLTGLTNWRFEEYKVK